MKDDLIVEQTLHGYSQGHHLLAASCILSESSHKIMSILSDLSGPEVVQGFTDYLTGYPLVNDKYYVFSRTWYAPEMRRPGCVWTHSVLIKFEDLDKINNLNCLLNIFRKPENDYNVSDYSNKIYLEISNLNNTYTPLTEKIKYLTWAVYNDNKPLLIPSSTSNEYIGEICNLWLVQRKSIRSNFSFCTGSLANRKLGKKTFDLQIVPYSLLRSLSRSNDEMKVYDVQLYPIEYPGWVVCILGENGFDTNLKFIEFVDSFGNGFSDKRYMSIFAKLYEETCYLKEATYLGEFLFKAYNTFSESDYSILTNNIIEHLFESSIMRWFKNDRISFLIELSTASHLKFGISNECFVINNKLCDYLINNESESKLILKGLISCSVNKFGESLIKVYSSVFSYKQLPELTDMDLGACNLLLTLNPEFAMCQQLWQQPKDFQAEMISCIRSDKIDDILTRSIIETIIEYSDENLYNQIFQVFGNSSIEVFLNWCEKANDFVKVKKWAKICLNAPNYCSDMLLNRIAMKGTRVLLILSVLDPYEPYVWNENITKWCDLFNYIKSNQIDDEAKLILAEFYLPLVLMSSQKLQDDIAIFSYTVIHNKLAQQLFDYDRWEKLEKLLPKGSWFNNWDKCKRLRNAMRQKGYEINYYESNDLIDHLL